MDRELDTITRRRTQLRRLLPGIGLLAIIAVLLTGLPGWLQPSVSRDRIRTAVVARGSVAGGLAATGEVLAARETVVASPLEARLVTVLRGPGSEVQPGDTVVELDTSGAELEMARVTDRVAERQRTLDAAADELTEELESLGRRLETARLDAEIVEYRLRQQRRLHDEGLASEEALRQAEVEARKTVLAVQQTEDDLLAARRRGQRRRQGLEQELELLRRERDELGRQATQAIRQVETAGVVTWVPPEEGVLVRRGEPLARVADLSSFRVEATVSDLHAPRLRVGQSVTVSVGRTELAGRVAAIRPAVEAGAVRFDIELEQASHPSLRPSLRTDVFVVTERRDDTLWVERGPFAAGGSAADVFVVTGDRAVRRPARFGLAGQRRIEVLEGLDEGDEIVVSDLQDYLHVEELKVRE